MLFSSPVNMGPEEMARYIDAVRTELEKINEEKLRQQLKEWDGKTKASRSQRCTWRDIWRGFWDVPTHPF